MVCARSKDPSPVVISWLDRWGFAWRACRLTSTSGHLNSMAYRTLKYAGHMYPVCVLSKVVLLRHDITFSSFFHTTRSPLLKTLLLQPLSFCNFNTIDENQKTHKHSPTQITSHIIPSLNSTWLTVSSNSKIPVPFLEPLVLLQRFTACSGTARTHR